MTTSTELSTRYPTWQELYERARKRLEKQLTDIQKLEIVYERIRPVLVRAGLMNDAMVTISDEIDLTFNLLPTDRLSIFDRLADDISTALTDTDIDHKPGSAHSGGMLCAKRWSFWTRRPMVAIRMYAMLPEEGCADCIVTKHRRKYESDEYELQQRPTTEPRHV